MREMPYSVSKEFNLKSLCGGLCTPLFNIKIMNYKNIKKFFHISNLIEGVNDIKEEEKNVKSFDVFKNTDFSYEDLMFNFHSNMGHLNDYCGAGELRDYDVCVGGKICLACRKIEKTLDTLLKQKPKTLEQIKNWHIDFEKIHPFGDGNGRVGRFLMLIQLQQNKLSIPELFLDEENFEENRQEYYKWFK